MICYVCLNTRYFSVLIFILLLYLSYFRRVSRYILFCLIDTCS
nr:MAG TPA: hypothetical protein [Bacteriophage sp.]